MDDNEFKFKIDTLGKGIPWAKCTNEGYIIEKDLLEPIANLEKRIKKLESEIRIFSILNPISFLVTFLFIGHIAH